MNAYTQLTVTLLAAQSFAFAGTLPMVKPIDSFSNRNLTTEQFSKKFQSYSSKGYLITDFEAYTTKSGTRYGMVWQKNTDKRGWRLHRGLSSKKFSEYWNSYKAKGFRPIDIEHYRIGKADYWAGIWVENKEKLAWSSIRNTPLKDFSGLYAKQKKAGYALANIEISSKSVTSIWLKHKKPTAVRWSMSRQQYQAEVNKQSAKGLQVVDYECYNTSSGQRYAAIWEKRPGYMWTVRTNLSEMAFTNYWREFRDDGYRLVDFECNLVGNSLRYSGIWAESSTRARYTKKKNLDAILSAQHKAQPNVPGMSVAIIKGGKLVYRSGVGMADIANGKKAHSGTVYALASVSKVIGATLAAKLEQQRSINLEKKTSFYLSKHGLPSHHKHNVAELFAHRAGIAHYNTTTSISNQSKHYTNATSAAKSIWHNKIITKDKDGKAFTYGKHSSYSTPGFTIAAAAMESATKSNISTLLDKHIFKPNGLTSMGVMYKSSQLAPNSERTKFYDLNSSGKIREINMSNNSWKVIGGGLEGSMVDLAKFGWNVTSGRIVSKKTLDNRLWKRYASSGNFGIGWITYTDSANRKVCEHGGSWSGTRTHLLIYPDQGLVIAVGSNSSKYKSGTRASTVAYALAREILKPQRASN